MPSASLKCSFDSVPLGISFSTTCRFTLAIAHLLLVNVAYWPSGRFLTSPITMGLNSQRVQHAFRMRPATI